VGEDLIRDGFGLLGFQRVVFHLQQLSVHSHERGVPDLKVDVGGALLDGADQEFVKDG
jgi:hypothetical protein